MAQKWWWTKKKAKKDLLFNAMYLLIQQTVPVGQEHFVALAVNTGGQ